MIFEKLSSAKQNIEPREIMGESSLEVFQEKSSDAEVSRGVFKRQQNDAASVLEYLEARRLRSYYNERNSEYSYGLGDVQFTVERAKSASRHSSLQTIRGKTIFIRNKIAHGSLYFNA